MLQRATCVFDELWKFVSGGSSRITGRAPPGVESELMLACCMAPLYYGSWRRSIDGMVTCSDASSHGGAVVASTGLSREGSSWLMNMTAADFDFSEDHLAIITLGDDLGAVMTALKKSQTMVAFYAAWVSDSDMRRVTSKVAPQAQVRLRDSLTMVEEAWAVLKKLRFEAPRVQEVWLCCFDRTSYIEILEVVVNELELWLPDVSITSAFVTREPDATGVVKWTSEVWSGSGVARTTEPLQEAVPKIGEKLTLETVHTCEKGLGYPAGHSSVLTGSSRVKDRRSLLMRLAVLGTNI